MSTAGSTQITQIDALKASRAKTENEIDCMLQLAKKSPGWNNRKDQPCSVALAGGCILHMVPAWLWQPRIRPQPNRCGSRAQPLRLAR